MSVLDNPTVWELAERMLDWPSEDGHVSTILSEDDAQSVYLFGWRDRIGGDPLGHDGIGWHDHGQSHAVVHVLYGAMWHRDPQHRIWREISKGDILQVNAGDKHDMQAGPAPYTVTLHVYTPKLVHCTYFNEEGKLTHEWNKS